VIGGGGGGGGGGVCECQLYELCAKCKGV
jgi:hypothetical protein